MTEVPCPRCGGCGAVILTCLLCVGTGVTTVSLAVDYTLKHADTYQGWVSIADLRMRHGLVYRIVLMYEGALNRDVRLEDPPVSCLAAASGM